MESLVRGNAALAERYSKIQEQEQLWNSIGSTIEGGILKGINAGIDAMVDGTKDLDKALQEILSGVLKDIGNALIKFGLNSLFSSMGGGGGIGGLFSNLFRAEGGPVTGGKPYIVGEEGPELMVPSTSGTVLSNSDTKAAMSRYTGNDAQSISDFVVGAGGYGGIFGRGADAVQTTFQLETTVINGVEYATVDQVRAMGAEATKNGAKMGEARTLRKLQMSPGSRRKVGM